MCAGPEIGLMLAAAGTGANMLNNRAALRAQDRQAARSIRNQADIQRQAANRTQQGLQDFAQSSPAGEQANLTEAYMNALRSGNERRQEPMQAMGAVNPRFAENVAGQQADMAQLSSQRAGNAGVIDAAALQRLREGQGINRAATDLGELGRRSQGEDFINRLRMSQINPNPWVGAAGSIMQGVGGAMAMMPPAAGAAAPGNPVTSLLTSPAGLATTPAAGGMNVGAAPWRLNPSSVPWWQNRAGGP